MRIGMHMPESPPVAPLMSAVEVVEWSRVVKAAGFEAIWSLDMIGAMRVQPRPDPFAYLLLAATATLNLEVGTAIHLQQQASDERRSPPLRAVVPRDPVSYAA